MEHVIKEWLLQLELDHSETVQAVMLVNIAKDYDEKRLTSTYEAMRRTFNDLCKSLGLSTEEFDPLAEMLKR
jgi:hypothetical protein